jgi:ankyrin repeat protein
MFLRALVCETAAVLLCAAPIFGAPTGNELLNALRDGDVSLVRRLVSTGAPVNAVDEFGSSALMYAALYSNSGTVRLLLARGADPNHSDEAGATALMWAAADETKVRLLVKRGARINVSSPLTGRTPLLIAAGRPGAAAAVRFLLEKGADPKARDHKGDTTLLRATYSGDFSIFRLLADRGVDVNAHGDFKLTALMEAVIQGNRQMAEWLLAHGADVRARDQDGFTVLSTAISFADPGIFRFLIGKGADPSVRSSTGVDLLMAASASDTATPEIIRDLRTLRVDPRIGAANLHTQHGYGSESERPLDWASRHGDTPVTRLLSEWTGVPPPRERPDEKPLLRAKTPQAAIGKALPLLYAGDSEIFKRGGCVTCHHNVLPALAYSQARAAGIVVDEDKVKRNHLQLLAFAKPLEAFFLQDMRGPNGDITATYLLAGFEASGHRRDRSTDALIHHLAGTQAVDGSWRVRTDRPPIESGRVSTTALSIRALRTYAIPGRKEEFEIRVRRAAKWLGEYRARTGEEKAMRLAGLAWAGAPLDLIREAAAQLASAQREDGGWAQLESLPSDAYATGQSLYALQTAGRLTSEVLERGVRFLLDAQLADGSWHVPSRSYPIQSNYFDTGFPHGRDQWISAAATSWACVGLSLGVKGRENR